MPETLLAADVGASKTLVATAHPGPGGWAWAAQPLRFATPRHPADVVELVAGAGALHVAAARSGVPGGGRCRDDQSPITAAAVAIPGPVDRERGVVSHLPNLGWRDVPLGSMLADRLGVPAVIDDDARLGALGEWSAGAGAGTRSLAYVTVSSGVGCGLIIDGQPWSGAHGVAGEFGHLVVDPGGPRCGCGRRGCVESYAGGLALARAAKRAWPASRTASGLASPRTPFAVFRLAEQGDPVAAGIIELATAALAVGMAAIAAVFDPDMIVVGGAVALGQRTWLRTVAARSRKRCIRQTGATMRITPAALGDLSALAGAAETAARVRAQGLPTRTAAPRWRCGI